jgi:pimeloyl-ACP methyl ester carboxylesterase
MYKLALTLASRESGTPPRVDVKFPDPVIPDTLAPYRQFVSVPAPSVSGPIGGPAYDGDVDINYALVGDVDADVIFWFWHGVPNNSYMWRAVISGLESRLSNTSESVAFLAHDFFGHGLSERINSVDCNVGFGAPPGLLHCDEPNYKPARHFEIMEAFSNALGLGDNGQKVVIVTHDWGGMTGLHWAGTHLDKLGGVATMESWMISCPDSEAYPNDGNQDGVSCFNNSPLSQSPGYEQFVRNAQRPYSDFQTFALSLEALFLEQEQNGFDIWIKDPFGLFGGSGMQQALSLGTIPQPIIDHYQSAFPAVNPPGESLRASFVQAPRSIPYPIPLAPQAPQDYNFPNGVGGLYDVGVQTMDTYIFNYTNNLRYNFSGPMMLMVAEPGTLYSVPGMIQAAEQNYQNQTAVCIGNESHMIPETTPFFVAQRLAEWALAEGILTSSKN